MNPCPGCGLPLVDVLVEPEGKPTVPARYCHGCQIWTARERTYAELAEVC